MILLKNMTIAEYKEFLSFEIQYYSKALIDDNDFQLADDAAILDNLDLFPNQLNTDSCKFLSVYDLKENKNVGGLFVEINNSTAFIVQLIIYDNFRNNKYAEKTLVSLEEHLLDKGIKKISLNVFNDNEAALHLYEKMDYVVQHNHFVNQKMEKYI